MSYTDIRGYTMIDRFTYEHRQIAESALGRKLNKDEVVHHLDYDKSNNSPDNLIITGQSTHRIIHARTDAIRAGFNPDTHALCSAHKTYLPKDKFPKSRFRWNGVSNHCKECANARRKGGKYYKWDDHARELQRKRREAKKKCPLGS